MSCHARSCWPSSPPPWRRAPSSSGTRRRATPIKVGDVLAEIETDKANMEMEALGAGVLRKILVPAGGKAPIGALIGVIAEPNEDIAPLMAKAGAAPRPRRRLLPRPRAGSAPPLRRLRAPQPAPAPRRGTSRRAGSGGDAGAAPAQPAARRAAATAAAPPAACPAPPPRPRRAPRRPPARRRGPARGRRRRAREGQPAGAQHGRPAEHPSRSVAGSGPGRPHHQARHRGLVGRRGAPRRPRGRRGRAAPRRAAPAAPAITPGQEIPLSQHAQDDRASGSPRASSPRRTST